MNLAPDGPMAIPLWINGRAFLTVAGGFYTVMDAQTGEAIRRVPLCSTDEANEAAASARTALPAWSALAADERRMHLDTLADALERFTGHFAKLIRQETGLSEEAATAEVAAAVSALRHNPPAGKAFGVMAFISDPGRPLSALAEAIAAHAAAGSTLVCKPSPKTPSAAFALCELASRMGWPPGVLNLMLGDGTAINGLCAAPVDAVVYAGEPVLGEKVSEMANRHGKPFSPHWS